MIALEMLVAEPQRKRVADRDVHDARELEQVEIADVALDAAREAVELGILGVDEHRAARGALADECALGAAKHFDRVDVVVRLVLEISRDRRGAVAIDHDAGRHVDVDLAAADAADVEDVRGAKPRDHHAGCRVLQVVQRRDALVLEQLAGQHGGRYGRALQAFGAAFSRDDDFFQPGVTTRAGRLLCECSAGVKQWRRSQNVQRLP